MDNITFSSSHPMFGDEIILIREKEFCELAFE